MKTTICNKPRVVEQLVVNWHVTEACNYGCRYCYSSWIRECKIGEVVQNPLTTSRILKELYCFFSPDNETNPLRSTLRWKEVRLSLAGGEALLYPEHIKNIAQEANELGFKVSLITNGSLLSKPDSTDLIKNLSMLGISIDSSDPQTNRLIGRIDAAKKILNLNDLTAELKRAHKDNPDLRVKINTVVNKYNVDEDLSEIITQIQPDKWKVLRVLPIANADLTVSDDQFWSFVNRHNHFGKVLSIEDNQDMTESYLMVDPFGRFFQNQTTPTGETPYIYSKPILQVGADAAFGQIDFDAEKFVRRYPTLNKEAAA